MTKTAERSAQQVGRSPGLWAIVNTLEIAPDGRKAFMTGPAGGAEAVAIADLMGGNEKQPERVYLMAPLTEEVRGRERRLSRGRGLGGREGGRAGERGEGVLDGPTHGGARCELGRGGRERRGEEAEGRGPPPWGTRLPPCSRLTPFAPPSLPVPVQVSCGQGASSDCRWPSASSAGG